MKEVFIHASEPRAGCGQGHNLRGATLEGLAANGPGAFANDATGGLLNL